MADELKSVSGIVTDAASGIEGAGEALAAAAAGPPQPVTRTKWYQWRKQGTALIAYLLDSEVHTFAFSVAANAIISFIPFVVLLYTLALSVFHSEAMKGVVDQMVNYYLPSAAKQQGWLVNTIFSEAVLPLLHHKSAQVLSLVMILIACTGIFLPLEVALNQAWGVAKSRNYLFNQTHRLRTGDFDGRARAPQHERDRVGEGRSRFRHFPQHERLYYLDFRWNRFYLSVGLQRRSGDPVPFLGVLRASEPEGAMAAGFAHFDYHGRDLAARAVHLCHGNSSHRSEHVRPVLHFRELAVLGVYFGTDPVRRSAVQRGAAGKRQAVANQPVGSRVIGHLPR